MMIIISLFAIFNNNNTLTNVSKTDFNDTIRLAFPNLTTNEGIIEDEEKKDNFYIFKRYEILKLAKGVLNKPLYGCVSHDWLSIRKYYIKCSFNG